jgi:trehalose/maltose hydrolase-like predicted phosphorylase
MARWNISRALDALDVLHKRWPQRAAELRRKLKLKDDELADWRDAVARIVTGLDPQTGLFEQFQDSISLNRWTSTPMRIARCPSMS